MFIDKINHQNINKKINLIDINKKQQRTENDKFSDKLKEYIEIGLEKLSKNQKKAKNHSEEFVSSKSGVSLNDVVIDLEKSSLSMQMAIQVRNKIMSAYQEIMSQQI